MKTREEIEQRLTDHMKAMGRGDLFLPRQMVDVVLDELLRELSFGVIAAGHAEMPWVSKAVAIRTFDAMIRAIKEGK